MLVDKKCVSFVHAVEIFIYLHALNNQFIIIIINTVQHQSGWAKKNNNNGKNNNFINIVHIRKIFNSNIK